MASPEEQVSTEAQGRAADRYSQLETLRYPFLYRARKAAALTLPFLITPEGSNSSTDFPTPYQSTGARGVNNLASKLLLALFPPNSPCFREVYSDAAIPQEIKADPTKLSDFKTMLDDALASYERSVTTEIESSNVRVSCFEAFKHDIVAGNVLVQTQDDLNLRVFSLEKYCVKRDPTGNVLEIVIKESVAPMALPEHIRDAVEKYRKEDENGSDDIHANVDVYTHIERQESKYTIYQEAVGIEIDDSQGTYPLDKLPWIPMRWSVVDGEDYGRGFIEEYIGDLKSLEGLSQAIVEGSAAAAKVLFRISPSSGLKAKTLAQTPNGGFFEANETDVGVLQMQKHADLSVASETAQHIEQRLAMAFLLTSSIQRDGERVTAQEIRLLAGDLDDSHGGIYSIFSQIFQKPYIQLVIANLEKKGKLKKLPKEIVKTTIITGLEALGRGHDLTKINAFMEGLIPEQFAFIHMDEVLRRKATAIGMDAKGIIKTKDELAGEQQQAMDQQRAQMMTKPAMDLAGKAMQMQGQQDQQQQQ